MRRCWRVSARGVAARARSFPFSFLILSLRASDLAADSSACFPSIRLAQPELTSTRACSRLRAAFRTSSDVSSGKAPEATSRKKARTSPADGTPSELRGGGRSEGRALRAWPRGAALPSIARPGTGGERRARLGGAGAQQVDLEFPVLDDERAAGEHGALPLHLYLRGGRRGRVEGSAARRLVLCARGGGAAINTQGGREEGPDTLSPCTGRGPGGSAPPGRARACSTPRTPRAQPRSRGRRRGSSGSGAAGARRARPPPSGGGRGGGASRRRQRGRGRRAPARRRRRSRRRCRCRCRATAAGCRRGPTGRRGRSGRRRTGSGRGRASATGSGRASAHGSGWAPPRRRQQERATRTLPGVCPTGAGCARETARRRSRRPRRPRRRLSRRWSWAPTPSSPSCPCLSRPLRRRQPFPSSPPFRPRPRRRNRA